MLPSLRAIWQAFSKGGFGINFFLNMTVRLQTVYKIIFLNLKKHSINVYILKNILVTGNICQQQMVGKKKKKDS